jgi:hypothetical protein
MESNNEQNKPAIPTPKEVFDVAMQAQLDKLKDNLKKSQPDLDYKEAIKDSLKPVANIPEGVRKELSELMQWALGKPVVMSCLYDLDLLPEQLEEAGPAWFMSILVMQHFREAMDQAAKEAVEMTRALDARLSRN